MNPRHWVMRSRALLCCVLGVVLLQLAVTLVGCRGEARLPQRTIGDLEVVHAEVWSGEQALEGQVRVAAGQALRTGADGSARLRLDDGALVAIDGATSLRLTELGIELEGGRVFVQAGARATTRVSLVGAQTTVTSTAAAFELPAGDADVATVTVASGELVLDRAGQQARVGSGETARLDPRGVDVAPEKAFDDWTGGLAAPWTSELGGFSTVAALEGRAGSAEGGSPFVIQAQRVEVEIDGELARTRTLTRYFNGSSRADRVAVRLGLPPGAILKGVSRRTGTVTEVAEVAISASPRRPSGAPADGLEWAGGGWLRGEFPQLGAGETLDLMLDYVEWLPRERGRASYRFPMDGGPAPQRIGELSVDVALLGAQTRITSTNREGSFEDGRLRHRAADVRPTSDVVIELENAELASAGARAYVQRDPAGGDAYVMVRSELPERPPTALSLVLVVDSSMSTGSATLEIQRAVVDAILEGLAPNDSVAVLAADQRARSVAGEALAPATSEVLASIRAGLAALRPAGASNLGQALGQAADLLDAPERGELAGSGMVIYVGDGRPTVGAPDARGIRAALAKRAAGVPRLGAIAVGANADRWLLAELVSGVGSIYEVSDRTEAARAGAALLSDALRPMLRDVSVDLGPSIDRIYPREAGVALAGATVAVLGRLRGELPKSVQIGFRSDGRVKREQRELRSLPLPEAADLPRRWASARIAEMALRDEGIEPAIALGLQAKLLTPWTGWFFTPPSSERGTLPFRERVLELSPQLDVAYGTRVEPILASGSTLIEPRSTTAGGASLAEATEAAVRRILDRARKAVQACRDARIGVRPDVGRNFTFALSVSDRGVVTKLNVGLVDTRGPDPVLQRCVEGVVRALPYYAKVAVSLTHTLTLPEPRASQRTRCSEASTVALPLRKSLWRMRGLDAEGYSNAARSCELRRWRDKREYLLMLLEQGLDPSTSLQSAEALEQAGQDDAAQFLREQVLRRVESFDQLEALTQQLRRSEANVDGALSSAFAAAKTELDQLEIVRGFLRLSPNSKLGRRLLLQLLESLGKQEALLAEIEALRADSIVDAGLLAQAASALRRLGREEDGRRAFGELVERAPRDPWTLAYVGDRLRAEGLHDEAVAAYESLARLMPDDAGVTLRLALAHAGAGRLDLAARLLDDVTQTGGRNDDGRLGELAAITRAVLLATELGRHAGETREQLERRLLQTPLPDVRGLVLVQSAPADDAMQVRVMREQGELAASSADLDARSLGLSAVRLERGGKGARILLSRERQLGPSAPRPARVAALLVGEDRRETRLVSREVNVPADGKPVEVTFDGEQLL